MFWLGLLLPVCFVPGYTGAIIPTQWAVLSILLPLGLWRSGAPGPSALAGCVALAWSALSLVWAPNTYDAGFGLWLAYLWALALWLGSTINDFRPLWQGLALGMTINSAVAIAQALGHTPVLTFAEHPSGLFFNSTLLGASAALVIIALTTQRQWLYIPGVLPGFVLAQSRGAYLVLALALVVRWFPVRYVLLVATTVAILALGFAGDSDTTRLTIWGAALRELTLFGSGIGSFTTFFLHAPPRMLYPGWVHNDYLQLWFELGIGAVAIYWLYALALSQRTSDHWPIFFAFTLFGLFYFPLWTPIPAFIGCMVAGAMLRDRHLDRRAGALGRYVSLSCPSLGRPSPTLASHQALPIASPN